MKTIKSGFVVTAEASFETSENYYIVMDLMKNKNLRNIIKGYRTNVKKIRFMIACIIQGLEDIHSYGILHKDIKPQNIIFDKDYYLRISDFGISKNI